MVAVAMVLLVVVGSGVSLELVVAIALVGEILASSPPSAAAALAAAGLLQLWQWQAAGGLREQLLAVLGAWLHQRLAAMVAVALALVAAAPVAGRVRRRRVVGEVLLHQWLVPDGRRRLSALVQKVVLTQASRITSGGLRLAAPLATLSWT